MSTTLEDVFIEQSLAEQELSDKIDEEAKKLLENQKEEYYEQSSYFFSYISPSDLSHTYQLHLNTLVKQNLWEYGAIIIWKVVILFCYEKMFQINKLGLLDEKFTLPLKNLNRDCDDSFSFNCIEDNKIIENLKLLWRNIDQNYQNMFQTLLHERNSLSHVNNYSYSEVKFRAFFEKSLDLLEYLEELHLKRITEIINVIKDTGDFPYLSEKEISLFVKLLKKDKNLVYFLVSLVTQKLLSDEYISDLKNNSIELFTTSNSFDIAYKRGIRVLKPLIPFFTKDDFIRVLYLIIKNQSSNSVNQILHAGGIDEIFTQMYFESSNNFPEIENVWIDFADTIVKNNAEYNFEKLKELMGIEL